MLTKYVVVHRRSTMLELSRSLGTVNYTMRQAAPTIGVIAPEDSHECEDSDEYITT